MKTLLEAMDDPNLFKPWFKNQKDWAAWKACLAALFGLPLSKDQQAIYEACTGRTISPDKLVRESHLIIGRRGGKSRIMALTAVYLSCFIRYEKYLAPGERGTVMVITPNKKQARNIMNYIRGFLSEVPMLKRLILAETKEGFELKNNINIEIAPASGKTIRGYTLVAGLLDELAFFKTDIDAAEPDTAILEALRPAMMTIPNSMLICASSPYSKRGVLWNAFNKYHGKNGADVLVWKADTLTMHPSASKKDIERAYAEDPASADAEYGGNFRSDIDAFISREVVEAATVKGRFELAPTNHFVYVGFADPSGGSSNSFTCAVCHTDPRTQRIVIDAVREVRPGGRTGTFSPEAAVSTCATLFKAYGVRTIKMDRYAAQFPVELFAKYGITCLPSELNRSEIYHELLPLLNSGRLELLDNDRANHQLVSLERRTTSSGRDSIDHPKGGKDDLINSIAGAAVVAASYKPLIITQEMLVASRQPPNRSIMSFGKKPPCYF